ncbi:MAG: hypothetical protein P3W87_008635 [Gammaproteobacteria bacterium]|nr:hypothetical protein [Gammaproteobacteria bacterium]
MAEFRARVYGDSALRQALPSIQGLLMRSPDAAQHWLDVHNDDPARRLDRVIAVCTAAIKQQPALAAYLQPVVPALVQEKRLRHGLPATGGAAVNVNVLQKSDVSENHAEVS